MNKNFELKFLATNWGFNGAIDEYCAKVKKEGYDGIEIWWPMEKKEQDELFDGIKKISIWKLVFYVALIRLITKNISIIFKK